MLRKTLLSLVLNPLLVVGVVLFVLGLSLAASRTVAQTCPSGDSGCGEWCMTYDFCAFTSDCPSNTPACTVANPGFCCYNAVGACDTIPYHRHARYCCNGCPNEKVKCISGLTG